MISTIHGNGKQQYDVRISPEDAKLGVPYCFNLNPKVQCSDYDDGYLLSSVRNWYDTIAKQLSTISHCDLELCLEISRTGRLHFHGTLTIRNYIGKFYSRDIPKFQGIGSFKLCEWKDCDNSSYRDWQSYCDKQKIIIEEFCKQEEIERVYRTPKTTHQKYKSTKNVKLTNC